MECRDYRRLDPSYYYCRWFPTVEKRKQRKRKEEQEDGGLDNDRRTQMTSNDYQWVYHDPLCQRQADDWGITIDQLRQVFGVLDSGDEDAIDLELGYIQWCNPNLRVEHINNRVHSLKRRERYVK